MDIVKEASVLTQLLCLVLDLTFSFFFLKLLLVCGFIEFFWVCQCHYPIGGESSTIGILSSEKLSYAWVPMEIEDLSL